MPTKHFLNYLCIEMSNKHPSVRRVTFKNESNTYYIPEGFTETRRNALEMHVMTYKRLLSNNQYLLGYHGRTLLGQLKEFKSNGFNLTKQCYYEMLHGRWVSLNYAIPYILSQYWGIPAKELMFEDLSAVEYPVFGR